MNKTLGLLLFGGGGAWLAYKLNWLCPFGIGDCANTVPVAAPPASAPTGSTPAPAPTTTPSGPAPGSTGFSLVGPVAPDVNNSIKGQVAISGSTLTLNCIPPGTIYQGATDVTGKLASQGVDTSALCSAMSNALAAQTAAAGTQASPDNAAAISGMQAMLAQLKLLVVSQPALQPQVDALTQQIAIAKKAAGLSGLTRRKPGLYALSRTHPINYVRKPRRFA